MCVAGIIHLLLPHSIKKRLFKQALESEIRKQDGQTRPKTESKT